MPKVDVNIFKAINPRWNFSVDAARKLADSLVALSFPRPEIVCHPQGDGKGWGVTQEQTLEDLARAGVPVTEPVNLLFWFPGRHDRQSCAQIVEDFAHGDMVGYERLYAVLNGSAQQGAWLGQLTRIPAVWSVITKAVSDVMRGEKPPAAARPPGGFNIPVPTPISSIAESGEPAGTLAEDGEPAAAAPIAPDPAAASEESAPQPTRPAGNSFEGAPIAPEGSNG